jgi:hypothetical protein
MQSYESTPLRAMVMTVGLCGVLGVGLAYVGITSLGNGWQENIAGLVAVGFGIAFLVAGWRSMRD